MMVPNLPATGVHDTSWVVGKRRTEEEIWGKERFCNWMKRRKVFFTRQYSLIPPVPRGIGCSSIRPYAPPLAVFVFSYA